KINLNKSAILGECFLIKRAIKERLAARTEKYGSPLRRTLKSYWKLRVGDYRVVFKISGYDILILGIMNRKSVYSQINKRSIVQ
ncbi:MAG: hypothetical protein U9R43_17245, partial [Thermodesulfobacteriota bacterium]|nr:hypothetical protein [Thermodesulfobacteriota bacterium]